MLLHGNEDFREQILDRAEKGGKSTRKPDFGMIHRALRMIMDLMIKLLISVAVLCITRILGNFDWGFSFAAAFLPYYGSTM